jgi:hypothetical protein
MATACSASPSAGAERIQASPGNLESVLARARPGDDVVLSPGDYGALQIQDRSWPVPIVVDAGSAHFSGITLQNVDGLTINGGTVVSNGDFKSHAVMVTLSHHISFQGMQVSNGRVAIALIRSDNINLQGVTIFDMFDDGVHIAMSRHVTIDHLVCRDWHPIARQFDAAGNLTKDAPHPDCVQAWSRPQYPPVSDVTITNTTVTGRMQGLSFFNHTKNGVDDGGFDRITLTENKVQTELPNGISLVSGRNSVIRDNEVTSVPGSVLARNGRPVRADIKIKGGSGNLVCGNRIPDKPNSPWAAPCGK